MDTGAEQKEAPAAGVSSSAGAGFGGGDGGGGGFGGGGFGGGGFGAGGFTIPPIREDLRSVARFGAAWRLPARSGTRLFVPVLTAVCGTARLPSTGINRLWLAPHKRQLRRLQAVVLAVY